MKKIRVYYAKMPNMGDLLNEYIIPKVTGYEIEHCENVAKFQIMGIGSCGGAVWSGKEKGIVNQVKDIVKKISCINSSNRAAVWGTGFLDDLGECNLNIVRKNTTFIALRGNKSKAIVEKMLNRKLDIPVCDGGILSDLVLDKPEDKRYQLGLIPHFREQEFIMKNGVLKAFTKKYPDLKIINLKKDPIQVIKEINRCELIVSSSLHGCVVADSFYIPNLYVEFSDIPGTGFKFRDYYSGFDLDIEPLLIKSDDSIPDIEFIKGNYKLTRQMIDYKKSEMKKVLLEFVGTL